MKSDVISKVVGATVGELNVGDIDINLIDDSGGGGSVALDGNGDFVFTTAANAQETWKYVSFEVSVDFTDEKYLNEQDPVDSVSNYVVIELDRGDDAPDVTNSTTDDGIDITAGETYNLKDAIDDGLFNIEDSDTSHANLMVNITGLDGGNLYVDSNFDGTLDCDESDSPITSFSYAEMYNAGIVYFKHSSSSEETTASFEFKLTDDSTNIGEQTFNFDITNEPPEVNSENELVDQTVNLMDAFTYQIPGDAFTDDDGDPLTYTPAYDTDGDNVFDDEIPSWLTFDGTDLFTGTPDDGGDFTIRNLETYIT